MLVSLSYLARLAIGRPKMGWGGGPILDGGLKYTLRPRQDVDWRVGPFNIFFFKILVFVTNVIKKVR